MTETKDAELFGFEPHCSLMPVEFYRSWEYLSGRCSHQRPPPKSLVWQHKKRYLCFLIEFFRIGTITSFYSNLHSWSVASDQVSYNANMALVVPSLGVGVIWESSWKEWPSSNSPYSLSWIIQTAACLTKNVLFFFQCSLKLLCPQEEFWWTGGVIFDFLTWLMHIWS